MLFSQRLSPFVVGLTSLLIACDSSPGRGPGEQGDGGHDGGATGGGDGGSQGDEGPPDAGALPDAGDEVPPNTDPGPITVRVDDRSGSGQAVGLKVAFNNPDGTLISTATTDAAGEVTEVVPPDAIVSLLRLANVETIYGVQPGETVRFAVGYREPAVLGTATVALGSSYPGATSYVADTGCETTPLSTGEPTELSFHDAVCQGTLLVVARTGSGTPVAWTSVENVTFDAEVTTGAWDDSLSVFAVELHNPPFSGPSQTTLAHQRGDGVYWPGVSHSTWLHSGGSANLEIEALPAFADRFQLCSRLETETDPDIRDRSISICQNVSVATLGASVDMGYPTVSGLGLSLEARPALRWQLSGPLPATADAILIWARWDDLTNERSVTWQVTAPPTTPSPLLAPVFPEDLAELEVIGWPPTGLVELDVLQFVLFDRGDRDGYRDLRTRPEGFLSGDAPIGVRSVRVTVGGVVE